MGRIIQKFKLGRDESKDPFEIHDTTAQSLMFIYLTGRGEYSYLFEAASVNEVIEEAGATIPMGYTQLWIIQWLKSVHPMSGDRKVRRARAGSPLRQERAIAGQSYLAIARDGRYWGWSESLERAASAAQKISNNQGIALAIGLLKADESWH